jgi:hypothetical protein
MVEAAGGTYAAFVAKGLWTVSGAAFEALESLSF